jgi:hypothetical protein
MESCRGMINNFWYWQQTVFFQIENGNDETGNDIHQTTPGPSQDEIEAKLEEMETGKRPQALTPPESKPETDEEIKTEIEQPV